MKTFEYNALPSRVVFGVDTLTAVAAEIQRLQGTRALIVSTPGRSEFAERVRELSGISATEVFAGATMHTPIEVTKKAIRVAKRHRADCLVAIGGGSTTGLSKAIALRTGLPQIAIPTTYAGSEMTPILGQTENEIKTTLNDPRVLPDVVIYDVRLTLSLPPAASGTSGINAIAHGVEALYARNKNPLTSLMAEKGIEKLADALPIISEDPQNLDARSEALFGAWLCSSCLASVGMALHHKLCHTLGGSFGLPHAETHTAVLPHAVAYNAESAPHAMRSITRSLKSDSAAHGLFELGCSVKSTMALRDLGLDETDLDRAAELACQEPYWNPRPINRAGIRRLLHGAWNGEAPSN